MKVIFNADDFGLSKGVNLGILEAYQNGPVRSATIMANMPGFDHAVKIAKENPGLGVGVHLTLTSGKSAGGVYRTITGASGAFFPLLEAEKKAKAGEMDMAEIESEYEAQIQKVLSAGIKPDHFDGHHHTQLLPGIITVYLKLAKKYGVKVRLYDQSVLKGEYAGIQSSGAFSDEFYKEKASVDGVRRICSACKADSIEIMCHPAYADQALYKASSYNVERTLELDVLTSRELADLIRERGLIPSSFKEI